MNPKTMITLRKTAKRLSMGGKFTVVQTLFRRLFRYASGTIRVADFDGDMVIDLRLSEHMQRRIFWMDYYNGEIVAVLKNILRPGMVMIDVGANIGEITLVAAKLVGRDGQIVAFEPMSYIAALLEQSVGDNHLDQVVIVRLGLSDTISISPIYESCGQGAPGDEHRGLGSLYGAATSGEPVDTIEVTTLDAYLQQYPTSRLDVLKIDVEGAELPCLKGAAYTIERYRPIIFVEIQEQTSAMAGYKQTDILDYLETFGYVFHRIENRGKLIPINSKDLGDYQNVLCVPRAVN